MRLLFCGRKTLSSQAPGTSSFICLKVEDLLMASAWRRLLPPQGTDSLPGEVRLCFLRSSSRPRACSSFRLRLGPASAAQPAALSGGRNRDRELMAVTAPQFNQPRCDRPASIGSMMRLRPTLTPSEMSAASKTEMETQPDCQNVANSRH